MLLLISGSSLSLMAGKGMLAICSAGCSVVVGLLWAESVSLPELLAGGTVAPAATVMLLWGPDSFSGSYECY
jgi:hypothetical protein